jgi:hypothetical protein
MDSQPASTPRLGAFITNGGPQSLDIPGIAAPVRFNNHWELLRALLSQCNECLLESPFLYKDFSTLVDGLNLTGKSVELISTCAARGEDQLDKPYALRSFANTFQAATGSWPTIHLNQSLHSKIYLFYRATGPWVGIVTSANLTDSGLTRSHETGVLVTGHSELDQLAAIARSRLDFVDLTEYQIGKLCAAVDAYGRDFERKGNVDVGLTNFLNTYVTPAADNPDVRLANTATYYIKVSGVTEKPILPADRSPFDEPHTTLDFAKQPNNIRLGDCLLEVAVGGKCFLPYYACASPAFERTEREQEENEDFRRWPYYVFANNLALNYGATWFQAPIYYDSVIEAFKRAHPGISVTQAGKDHFVPAMQRGHSYIPVTREFGEFVCKIIDAFKVPGELSL